MLTTHAATARAGFVVPGQDQPTAVIRSGEDQVGIK